MTDDLKDIEESFYQSADWPDGLVDFLEPEEVTWLIDEVKQLREQVARALVLSHSSAQSCPEEGPATRDCGLALDCNLCRANYILEGKAI